MCDRVRTSSYYQDFVQGIAKRRSIILLNAWKLDIFGCFTNIHFLKLWLHNCAKCGRTAD